MPALSQPMMYPIKRKIRHFRRFFLLKNFLNISIQIMPQESQRISQDFNLIDHR
jgi:hypothetical protein